MTDVHTGEKLQNHNYKYPRNCHISCHSSIVAAFKPNHVSQKRQSIKPKLLSKASTTGDTFETEKAQTKNSIHGQTRETIRGTYKGTIQGKPYKENHTRETIQGTYKENHTMNIQGKPYKIHTRTPYKGNHTRYIQGAFSHWASPYC